MPSQRRRCMQSTSRREKFSRQTVLAQERTRFLSCRRARMRFPFLYKFVQTPTLLVQLAEDEPAYRQIFIDGRKHPENLDPAWKGHSIGRWEGDTLVVDTVGFNDKSWLTDGFPHTEKMHVVERY